MPSSLDFQNEILDRLKGKLSLNQSPERKNEIIVKTFQEFCSSILNNNNNGRSSRDCRSIRFRSEEEQTAFFRELESLGVVDEMLKDSDVEDILINGTESIYIHHATKGLVKTDKSFPSIEELELVIKKILVYGGKPDLLKINNIDLIGLRGRANIIYSPLGPQLTITRIKTAPMSIIDLVDKGALTLEMAALLWLYVEGLGVKAANIMIAGGPGCGKTTLLNALLSFIPNDQHVVIIEDSLELSTRWIDNAARLETSEDLTLADLVKNSLRMRPERIIIGEVRGEEAQDMMTAMNTGKYCMCTIHAGTPRETVLRLSNRPMNVPERLIDLIDVIIVMHKLKIGKGPLRVIESITEIAGLEATTPLLSPVWKYDVVRRDFIPESPTTVFRDRLGRVSGLNGKEILDEIERRKKYLEVLQRENIRAVDDIAVCCQVYRNRR